jgi:NADPH:quinone reductase-like Zn-dependent oxidoreductase
MAVKDTMRAVRIERYGEDALAVVEVPTPKPQPGDAVVEVHAASLNPIDWKIADGRLRSHFDLPLPHVMGRDFSGTVAAVGEAVTGLAVGDEVYGVGAAVRDGSHAEYIAVEPSLVARRPRGLSHVEAAALPLAGLSAIAGVIATADVRRGQKVLIHAGAGGVGSLAIQIAKHLGARVAATASAANLDYVRGLGADVAIDYARDDFAAKLRDYDAVFDTMGGEVHRRSFAVLRPGGVIAWLVAAPIPKPARDDVAVKQAVVRYETAVLDRLTALVESGAVKPQIAATIPLAEAPRAYALSRTGHVRGKIILQTR